MSRIGKQVITIPEKVEIKIDGYNVKVKGPKGELELNSHQNINVKMENNEITVNPIDDSKKNRALWGLTRTLINNMVLGVTTGFEKDLEFNGVGYRAAVKGNTLTLNLGYSHPINYEIPTGLTAKVVKNTITVAGIDKALVGFAAAKIRSFRKPEPYKGKGIKYATETIIKKAGKTGAKK